jgi:FtsH-binding integral membrane protein
MTGMPPEHGQGTIALDDPPERRLNVRFRPSEGLTGRLIVGAHVFDTCPVVDLSLAGCQLVAASASPCAVAALSAGAKGALRFHRPGKSTFAEMPVCVRGVDVRTDALGISIQFETQLPLEAAGPLLPDLSCPENDVRSRKHLHALQEETAKSDQANLTAASRDLKLRNFTLALTAVTLIGTGMGIYLTSVGAVTTGKAIPGGVWLAPVAVIPSLLGVFLTNRLVTNLRLVKCYGAFMMILQRASSSGSLPPKYRGWEDAYANFNRRRRKEACEGKRFTRRPGLQPKHRFMLDAVHPRRHPADRAEALCVMLFLIVLPLTSFVIVLFHAGTVTLSTWLGAGVFLVTILVWLLVAIHVSRNFDDVYSGGYCYENLVLELSEILHADSPYDAYDHTYDCAAGEAVS